MARAPRIQVPNLPPPPGGGPGVEEYYADSFGPVVPFDHPGLNLFNETGDMAALQDANFTDWTWTVYRLRTPEEMRRDGTRQPRVFVTKTVGPFDIMALQQTFGGGVYEIRGTFDKHLRIRHIQELEGPRKSYEVVPTPARPFLGSNPPLPEYTRSPVADTSEPVLRLLEQQGRVLERISERLAVPAVTAAPAAPAQGMGIADVIALADRMNQREVATPTSDTIKELMGVFRSGLDMSRELAGGGGPETTTAERVLEKVLPSLERIAVGLFSGGGNRVARPAGAPAHTAAPGTSGLPTPPPVVNHPTSTATVVVEPAAAAPAETVEPEGSYRWKAAIEALANAITRGDDPLDFPDTLELILPEEDLAMLRGAPDDAVIVQVRQAAGGAFPVLDADEFPAWMRAMLAELREPTEVGEL